ncbi:hypothetical protein C369_07335 [Cryptococcus neoformans A5-35-17]|nr:hypothetical protein C369_07335 [Cryptococcus neoformans var. grubii A5-35-17]
MSSTTAKRTTMMQHYGLAAAWTLSVPCWLPTCSMD